MDRRRNREEGGGPEEVGRRGEGMNTPQPSSHLTAYTPSVPTEQHFGGLLNSAVANDLVEKKIDTALAGPEGL